MGLIVFLLAIGVVALWIRGSNDRHALVFVDTADLETPQRVRDTTRP